jgi:hypothetical protein
MTVLRRPDGVLEPTKQAVLDYGDVLTDKDSIEVVEDGADADD